MSDIVDAVEVLLAPLVVHVLAFGLDDLQRVRLVEECARLPEDIRTKGDFMVSAVGTESGIRMDQLRAEIL